jgi:hypothetical protein
MRARGNVVLADGERLGVLRGETAPRARQDARDEAEPSPAAGLEDGRLAFLERDARGLLDVEEVRDEDRVAARRKLRQKPAQRADPALPLDLRGGRRQARQVEGRARAAEREARGVARTAVAARQDLPDRESERAPRPADRTRVGSSTRVQISLPSTVREVARIGVRHREVSGGMPEVDDIAAAAQRAHERVACQLRGRRRGGASRAIPLDGPSARRHAGHEDQRRGEGGEARAAHARVLPACSRIPPPRVPRERIERSPQPPFRLRPLFGRVLERAGALEQQGAEHVAPVLVELGREHLHGRDEVLTLVRAREGVDAQLDLLPRHFAAPYRSAPREVPGSDA